MHNAPAVNYPVGRSPFQGGFFLVLVLLSAAVFLYWLFESDAWGWPHTLAFGAWLVAALTAMEVWRRPPRGELRWDGQIWSRTDAGATTQPGQPAIRLDFQSDVLLEFRPQAGPAQWLWLTQRVDAHRWNALRRALHAASAGAVAPADIGRAGS